jgi:hypothetical protein
MLPQSGRKSVKAYVATAQPPQQAVQIRLHALLQRVLGAHKPLLLPWAVRESRDQRIHELHLQPSIAWFLLYIGRLYTGRALHNKTNT